MSGGLHAAVGVQLEGAPYDVDADDDLTGPEWDDEEYRTWDSTNSRVISGPLGTRASFPGTRHETWQTAQAYVETKYQLIKFGCLPGRWFARIKR